MALAAGEGSSRARSKPTSTGSKKGGPTLNQLSFHWGSVDKYIELKNFRFEVNNIYKTYNTNEM